MTNREARPTLTDDGATNTTTEEPATEVANPGSVATISNSERTGRTNAEHRLHPTGSGAVMRAGG